MKDGLTQVEELKDKIHEQYIEIQELNKARKTDIEYNKYLQKEIIRLNNIINGMGKFFQYAYDNEVRPLNNRKVSVWTICLDKLQELKGENNE